MSGLTSALLGYPFGYAELSGAFFLRLFLSELGKVRWRLGRGGGGGGGVCILIAEMDI